MLRFPNFSTLNLSKSAADKALLQQCAAAVAVGSLIQNPHKILQAGRSTVAQQQQECPPSSAFANGTSSLSASAPFGGADGIANSAAHNWPSPSGGGGTLGRRNASVDQIRLGNSNNNNIISQTLSSAHQQQKNCSLNTRSISMESAENAKSSSQSNKKAGGTNTLRRIFRFGGKHK